MGVNNIQNIDFSKRIITSCSKNMYLVIPLDLYHTTKLKSFKMSDSIIGLATEKKAHIFKGITAQELRSSWNEMISSKSRVTLEDIDHKSMKYCYSNRSKYFNIKDYITVQFIDICDNGSNSDNKKNKKLLHCSKNQKSSTIAIYARRGRGKLDFQQNQKRVTKWLKELHEFLDKQKDVTNGEHIRSPCSP
jgi:predicted RNA-binding protein with RPS1 domain